MTNKTNMTYKTYKKSFAFLAIAVLLFAGAVFVLGGFGRSGPSSAPNLAEYGLVGYWNMEEGKGQTVYDRSGNSNNGTLGASTAVAKDDPVFTSGYSSAGAGGTGLKFDGKDDYVDAGNGASLNITNAITISAWVKPQSTQSTYSGIFGQENLSIENAGLVRVGDYWTGVIKVGGSVYYVSDNVVYTTYDGNTWVHFVVTYDGETAIFYKNSVNVGTNTVPSGQMGTITDLKSIGRHTTNFFNGSIDEVRIYNRALSADEIRQHYNQKKPILEWKFDEGSGTTTKDESFNNNDGTLHE